jgi:hypothetical protein
MGWGRRSETWAAGTTGLAMTGRPAAAGLRRGVGPPPACQGAPTPVEIPVVRLAEGF